jgi:hypothetical protein
MPYKINLDADNALTLGNNSFAKKFNTNTINVNNLEVLNSLQLTNLNSSEGFLFVGTSGFVSKKIIETPFILDNTVTSSKIDDSIELRGVPTAPTASFNNNTTQIANTEFVTTELTSLIGGSMPTSGLVTINNIVSALDNDANYFSTVNTSIATKVSLTGDELITGVKTFSDVPVFSALSTDGIIHNDASGNLTSSLLQTVDIADGVITGVKMDPNLVLPSMTELDPFITNSSDNALVVKGFLNQSIKVFTDVLSNVQPLTRNSFFHVTVDNVSYPVDDSFLENPYFELSDNIRHIIDFSAKIILPSITVDIEGEMYPLFEKEGLTYSLINKSGATIEISTYSENELIFNTFVAPDGDNNFELGPNQCLDFVCISANSTICWQASYY